MSEDDHDHEDHHDDGHDHHDHGDHGHHHGPGHTHSHGVVDPSILVTDRGIWAVKWSFVGLMVTTVLQAVVVVFTGSVALLADTVHNLGDALTAIPLWIAFLFARRKPDRRFPHGYGRVEDLAGLFIIVMILFSAVYTAFESIRRLLSPQDVDYLGVLVAASLIGFIGNEAVAIFRIRVGRQIGSAALIADGHHARTDGWTSLAVLAGAIGIWAGYPLADAIAGLVITVAILWVVWGSGKTIFVRLLGGVDEEILDELERQAAEVEGVLEVSEVRATWSGHWLRAEVNVAVDGQITVAEGHEIAKAVRRFLLDENPHLHNVMVHLDPDHEIGEDHHRFEHRHGDGPLHAH